MGSDERSACSTGVTEVNETGTATEKHGNTVNYDDADEEED